MGCFGMKLPTIAVTVLCVLICKAANGQYRAPEQRCPEVPPGATAETGFVYVPCQLATRPHWRRDQPLPLYPRFLLAAGVGGDVVLEFVVTPQGRIDSASVRVLKSPHDAFTSAVLEALQRWRAHPGRRDKRPVAVSLSHTFKFVIAASGHGCRDSEPAGADTTIVCGSR